MSNTNGLIEKIKEWFTEKNDERVFSDEALSFIVGS